METVVTPFGDVCRVPMLMSVASAMIEMAFTSQLKVAGVRLLSVILGSMLTIPGRIVLTAHLT